MPKITAANPYQISEDEYHEHVESMDGICLECGAVREGMTEPDAENYPCESCGASAVQGMELAMVCGNIEIREE